MLSRKSYELSSVSTFDNPLSSRFDENDAVLYFDQVKIPWDRVFVHKNVQMISSQWHATPAHVYQNYQCQIRFTVKMRFLLGVARRIAETNGIIDFPAVVETLGQMAAEVSMVEGLVEAMEVSGSQRGEYFIPNPTRLYAANVLTQQLYPKFLQSIRELSGGGLIMVPSSVSDFSNTEMANLISQTQTSPVTNSTGRVKLFKLAWDAIGSEFGSRHLQYEMFYSGSNMVSRGHSYRNYNWQRSLDIVDQFMAGYGLPEKKNNKILEPVID
jgi:4-hydroxyphenylacetate 3-monooxygenase